MKNRILLLFAFCAMTGMMVAQETPVQQLNVWKMDGSKISFLLSDEPVTTFENGNLVITTNQSVYSYPLAQMKKYTHEGQSEGMDNSPLAPGDILVRQNDEQLLIEGLPDNYPVTVYNMDGKQIYSQRSIGGQPLLVSLIGQPQGSYIITAGSTSFKFVKQ